MLGGAALTRRYVEEECVKAYGAAAVAYARDAFDGLALMDQIVGRASSPDCASPRGQARRTRGRQKHARKLGRASTRRRGRCRPIDLEEIRLRRAELSRGRCRAGAAVLGHRAPSTSIPGARASCPISTSACSINSSGASGRTGARSPSTGNGRGRNCARCSTAHPRHAIREEILQPQAAYGYWPCAAEGNDVILYRRRTAARGRALRLPAPEQGRRAVHRRFLPRRRRRRRAT